jgi:hypothetical protein
MKNRGIMRAAIVAALGSSIAFAAACSSSSTDDISTIDASIPSDASLGDENPGYSQDAGAPSVFYSSVRLENDLCFPNALPIDGGLVDCHVVLLFPSATSCASLGLANASTADSMYLDDNAAANGVPLPNGAFCALDQLPADACLADASAGWCYVPGGCEADSGCAQSLCASSGYAPDGGTYTWLVCP